MGFSYLDNKNWIDISREERLYCAHLYFQIKGKELQFVKWLNEFKSMYLTTDCEWEIGYEVCFYRDYLKNVENKSIRVENRKYEDSTYSEKRTFDLCLFSEDTIIIIEAKVKEKFEQKQLDDIKSDKALIKRLIGDKIKVLRNKQELTQDALARKCDIPYTTLTKIESNVITKPSIQTVAKIAKGLGISIDDLIK